MFRAHPDTEPTSGKLPEVRSDELIPLSVLRLDLPHVDATFLAGRGTEIVLDSLGREAVSHSDAKRLFTERAEHEARKAEMLRAAEEYDREWRRMIGAGIPASSLPLGMTYAEAAKSLELDGLGYAPRASVVADVFEAPDSLVFHPITGEPAE